MKHCKWLLCAVLMVLSGALAAMLPASSPSLLPAARQTTLAGEELRPSPANEGPTTAVIRRSPTSWLHPTLANEGPALYRDQVLVLMYHNISPVVTGHGTITPRRFASDIALLQAEGFQFISADSFAAWLDGREPVPGNAVLLTFDDGYRGVYDHVFPVLARYRAPATVFIIVGEIGSRQDLLDWPQVRALDESGLVTIGAHTFRQHYYASSGPGTKAPATVTPLYDPQQSRWESRDAYGRRLAADCRQAQEALQLELGHPTPYFAYPYGAYNPDLVQILNRAGYRYLFTVLSGANTKGQDPLHIYRVNAGVPWLSPGRLLLTIQDAAAPSGRRSLPPPAWTP